jgi:hypothetical protein
MKKLSISIILLWLTAFPVANAQNIQIVMSPKPSPYLSDWETHTETLVLIVNNISGKSIDVKVKTQLYNGNNNVIAETDLPKMPVLSIPSGVSSYHAEDIYPINSLKYDNSYKDKLLKTGRLPDDNYRLCVSLADPKTGEALTAQQPQCKIFNITAYQAPILLSPRDKDTVTVAQTKGFLFKWTPVVPSPAGIVSYRLQVWEILPGQDAMRAFLGNQPILEKDYKAMTQAPWPPDFELPRPGMGYVWSIQALDADMRPVVDNGGRAEPLSFWVQDDRKFHRDPDHKGRPSSGIRVALISPTITESPISDRPEFTWKIENGHKAKGFSRVMVFGDTDSRRIITRTWIAGDTESTLSFTRNWVAGDTDTKCTFTRNWVAGDTESTISFTRNWVAGDTDTKRTFTRNWVAGDTESTITITRNWVAGDTGPRAIAALLYSIKVVEIRDKQSPDAALKFNHPILDEKGIKGTSFTYPSSAPPLDKNKTYVCSVTAMDQQGNKVSQNIYSGIKWSFKCHCGKWSGNPMTWSGGGTTGSAACNTSISVSSGISYTFSSPAYFCVVPGSGCMPLYKWKIDGIFVGTGTTLTHTFTAGAHTIIIIPICGNHACTPCAYKVTATGAACKCGKWSGNTVSWNGGGATGTITFNTGATLSSGIPYSLTSPVYVCIPSGSSCSPVYKWRVDGTLVSTGATLVYTFSTGTHLVSVTPFCGNDSCIPCTFKIDAKPMVCNCGNWTGSTVNISGYATTSVTFGATITLVPGVSYTFTPPVYSCIPSGCPPSYLWNINGGPGVTSPTVMHTFTASGTYSVTITTNCGGIKCTGANFQVKIP